MTLTLEALAFGSAAYQPLNTHSLMAEQETLHQDAPSAPRMIRLSVRNTSSTAWEGIIRIGAGVARGNDPYFLLPGFMVGTNRGDAPLYTCNRCARLREGDTEYPASGWWQVRADRLSHPLALVMDGGRICALSGAVRFEHHGARRFAGYGCDINRRMVFYTLGWENAPWLFIDSQTTQERDLTREGCIRLESGESISAELACYELSAHSRADVHSVVRNVYARYHEPPRKGAGEREAVTLLSGAIDRDAWLPEECMYSGFVFDRGDHMEYRPLPSASWTNGASVAMPMLLAAHRLGDSGMRAHALAFLDRVVRESMNPRCGLPYTSCTGRTWHNRGWWFDKLPAPGHSGYIIGQTLYSLLKAYEAEERHAHVRHDNWLAFVRQALERVERARNTDGEYAYVLSEETGTGLSYGAMGSAWCLAAGAYARLLTGERGGLDALLESERHYYRAYVARVCCYGGPMDIDMQVDSEGVLAYLRAVRCLHQLTGDPVLLDHMRDALEYEFTFKFCYNAPVQVPPLDRGWSSCGGSVTSVTNPHIHPMSSSVVDEMLYYLHFREDSYVESRLGDTVGWSLQTFSRYDGEYDYGRAGWMSERFCHSQGLLTERYPDGSPASTWFALMPWAGGCILEGLCGAWWDKREI